MSRVLVIGGWPPSLVNFRGRLMEAMRARGHEVIACAGGADSGVAACLQGMGIRYIPLPLERAGINPLKDLCLIRSMIALMREQQPDVVLAYTAKPVIYGMLAARLAGIRRRHAMITGLGYAFIARKSLKQRVLAGLVPRLYRLALTGADTVFFQNNDDLALFHHRGIMRTGSRSLRVMGSGVDLERFAYAPLPQGSIVFLLIARLIADKGIREYVEAARMLRTSHPDVRFALLGPIDPNPSAIGPSELAEWVSEGVVEYWGETEDVRPFLSRCSVYVLPSYREGMPRSVLEAMAMGRPVITTDVPGCRDTVEEGRNGYLVPARDAVGLASAMRRCLDPDTPLFMMGSASRKIAEREFGSESVNQTLLEGMHL